MTDLFDWTPVASKEEAFELFEEHRPDWLAKARATARQLFLSTGEPVTADDIHQHCPIPKGFDPRVMGAVFKNGEWEPVGFVLSKRAVCHHRPIRAFRLKAVA